MDSHRKKIWQRGSAREIMEDARRKFRLDYQAGTSRGRLNAHVALASAHHSLVKRYLNWRFLLAAWHMWRAGFHARMAAFLHRRGPTVLTGDQVDVVSTVLRVPYWVGGDRNLASALIHPTLSRSDLKPHTRALMHITLAEIARQDDDGREFEMNYMAAEKLIPAIRVEELDDRECQLIRVLAAVGFFYYDLGEWEEKARTFLLEAWTKAGQIAQDQQMKIERECRKRGIKLD